MTSIRLFILASFSDHGEMHGHQMRLVAKRNYVHLWTDITVGAVYAAIKRLANEGLLEEVHREHKGNRPARQTFTITAAGHEALKEARAHAIEDIWFKFDPFDLGLTRVDPNQLDMLPGVLEMRLASLRSLLEQTIIVNQNALQHVTLSEKWALSHTEYRLRAEIQWMQDLIAAVPVIIDDERALHTGKRDYPLRGTDI
jgi:DNA-binding PadR family transcriptional regulator